MPSGRPCPCHRPSSRLAAAGVSVIAFIFGKNLGYRFDPDTVVHVPSASRKARDDDDVRRRVACNATRWQAHARHTYASPARAEETDRSAGRPGHACHRTSAVDRPARPGRRRDHSSSVRRVCARRRLASPAPAGRLLLLVAECRYGYVRTHHQYGSILLP